MKILRENTPGESSMQSSIQTAPEALAPTAAPAAPTAPETTPETRFRCRHIHVSGTRCGSPCLRREPFCYFHHTTRPPVTPAQVAARAARRADFALPMPEDRAAIQLSIGEVLQRIAANQLDPRRAGLLLYGLQIASGNLPPQAAARPLSALAESAARELVEEIEHDPELGTLAPQANLADPPRYRNAMRVLLDKIERKDAARRQQEALELHKKKLELEQQMLHEQAHNLCPSCAATKAEPAAAESAVAESAAILPEVQAVAVPTPATSLLYPVSDPSESAGLEAACPSSNLSSANRSPHRRSAPSASAPSPASPSSASTPSAPQPTARRPRSRCSSRWGCSASTTSSPSASPSSRCYRQTIDAYPHGGGSYTVASENLGEVAGLFAAGRTHPVSGAHAPGAPDRRPGSRAGREGLDTGAAAQSARAVVEADASAARQPAHHGHQYTVVFLSRKLNGTVLAG
jgi:hypothetical protein